MDHPPGRQAPGQRRHSSVPTGPQPFQGQGTSQVGLPSWTGPPCTAASRGFSYRCTLSHAQNHRKRAWVQRSPGSGPAPFSRTPGPLKGWGLPLPCQRVPELSVWPFSRRRLGPHAPRGRAWQSLPLRSGTSARRGTGHPTWGLPCRWVRGEHYRYKFSRPGGQHAAAGKWWVRKKIGAYFPPLSLRDLKDYFRSREWPYPEPD